MSMRSNIAAILAGCLGIVWGTHINAEVVLEPSSPLTLAVDSQNNTATGTFILHNRGDGAVSLRVFAADFISPSQNKGQNARALFAAPGDVVGKQVLDLALQSDQDVVIRVDISNLREPGESVAALYIGKTQVGAIRAINYRPPFNITVDHADDAAGFTVEKGTPCLIVLRNNDPMTYDVSATITIRGHTQELPLTTLPPLGAKPLIFEPGPELLSSTGLLADDMNDGILTLNYKPNVNVTGVAWPSKVIPIHSRLRRTSIWLQELVVGTLTLLFLVAGGLCSLILSNWIPNATRRAMFFKQIGVFRQKTDTISNRVAPKVLVAVGVRREQLADALRAGWAVTADYGSQLDEVAAGVVLVSRHIELTVKLDDVLTGIDDLTNDQVSPSVVRIIDNEAVIACNCLSQHDANVDDLNEAERHVTNASLALARMTNPQFDTEVSRQLTKRYKDLLNRLCSGNKFVPPFDSVQAQLSELFAAIAQWQSHVEELSASKLAAFDADILRGELLERFFLHPAQLRDPLQVRLFTSLKDPSPLRMYRDSQQVLAEIADGVTVEEVVRTLREANSVSISHSPGNIVQSAPITFEIHLHDCRLDKSAARKAIFCEWDFGHDALVSHGWSMVHFFPFRTKVPRHEGADVVSTPGGGSDRAHLVKAWFRGPDGSEITWASGSNAGKRREEWVRFEIASRRSHSSRELNKLQAIHLIIALLIALIGLIAGAKEQFAKVSLGAAAVGIFMLGFTADAVRNALSSRVFSSAGSASVPNKK